jgi:hypothetical protein
MGTSIFAPSDWMVNDGSKYNDKGDIVKDADLGGWVKIYPDGTKELLHFLRSPGNAAPYITSVTNHANGTYSSPETLSFTVTFSEIVTVTGTPALQVYTEAGEVFNLDYASGSGSDDLVFSGAPEGITDGNIILVKEIYLGSGSIVDAAENTVNDDFPSDYVQPTGIVMSTEGIVTVTNMADDTYENTDILTFEVEFSGAVDIGGTGTPKLTIYTEVGSPIDLPVTAGDGTDTLTFSGAATAAADGTLIVVETLKLATSTLSDANGNPVLLAFPADYVQPVIDILTP